jgi:tellurite resistance protein TehA-like permease
LLIGLLKKLWEFVGSAEYKELMADPLKNNVILAPFIAVAMFMNVLIGPVRFFVPSLAAGLQGMMLPALVFWLALVAWFLVVEIRVLKSTFTRTVDLSKVGFGWLLDVFALSMLAVTGSGIAALSKNAEVAHTAAFFALMLIVMAGFWMVIKVVLVFQRQFAENDLPEKEFLPSFLNLVPAVTLMAITFFRLGHYLEAQQGFHLDWYFTLVILGAFAFETWYLLFGLSVLKDYFLRQHFEKEFLPSQWGLICPFVAYAVLGSFAYSVFVLSPILIVVILVSLAISVILFLGLLRGYWSCCVRGGKGEGECR